MGTTEAPDRAASSLAERVTVLAPFGRDAQVVCGVLTGGGVACTTVAHISALAARVREGVGAALLTEEALAPGGVDCLIAALKEQPSWSDVPVLLLLADDDRPVRGAAHQMAALSSAGSVTLLQRPVPAFTLVTAAQSALRARWRQYEVRDLIARERAAREVAEAATRLKDEFLATISHELRTPMSAILLWSQLLEGGLEADEARRAARAIVCSAEAQSRLIDDLLDASRMLVGKLRLDVHACALAPLAAAAVEVVRPMAEARGVRLDAGLGAGDEVVLADADRIRQVLWNLLNNAVRFTPAGGVVSLRVAREGDHVRVRVTDSGEGISPAFLPHVFERFRQADAASTRRQGGLGLGLALVHDLVALHGGTVAAESEGEGRGATFTVRLPVYAR